MKKTEANEADQSKVEWLEADGDRLIWVSILAAFLTAILFDYILRHARGYTGWSVFFVLSSMFYVIGTIYSRPHKSSLLSVALLWVLALRMVWLGIPIHMLCGFFLLPMLAMTRVGMVPYLTDHAVYIMQSFVAAGWSIFVFCQSLSFKWFRVSTVGLLSFALPVFALVVFSAIFIKANPDLADSVNATLKHFEDWIVQVMNDFHISFLDAFVVAVVSWLVLGQLRPLTVRSFQSGLERLEDDARSTGEPESAPLFVPIRNTLVAVISLFVVYLIFEFSTLWFREFPEGFYYAGYAHQGAAWLTFALALATGILSIVFHGDLLCDPRLETLKKLAWGWSAANFVLALSVYNRLWIYIQFNGMTYMRMVGLFGITTVVAGFLLVVWKIRHDRRFVWLIQRQLWVLAFAIYAFCVTPVDYLVHSWNVREILSGHLAPAVQITEHSVDESGWLVLHQLVDCEDETIRNGIRAKLAEFYFDDFSINSRSEYDHSRERDQWSQTHWSSYQMVREQLRERVHHSPGMWSDFDSSVNRIQAWDKFRDYAYQWY